MAPDTNVLLHGRRLAQLPWTELGSEDVTILIMGPVNREIDKYKLKGGRIGKRAKAVYTEIREALELPARTKILREASPRVIMTVVPGTGVKGALHDCLDLTVADHQLVNHCLAQGAQGVPVRLLTNDTGAFVDAEEAGLGAILIKDHWMLEPEPDETAKKVKQLEGDLERLKAQEPKIVAEMRSPGGDSILRYCGALRYYPQLLNHQIIHIMEWVDAFCPPATEFGSVTEAQEIARIREAHKNNPLAYMQTLFAVAGGTNFQGFEPASEEAIEIYRRQTYPKWREAVRKALEEMQSTLNACRARPTFELAISNIGVKPADGVLIAMTARGSFTIGRFPIEEDGGADLACNALPQPPQPPRGGFVAKGGLAQLAAAFSASPRSRPANLDHVLAELAPIYGLQRQVDPSGFDWTPKRGKNATVVEAFRSKWRHQGEDLRERFFIETEQASGILKGAIDLKISAHNLSDPLTFTYPIEIEIEEGDTMAAASNLVDDLAKKRPETGYSPSGKH
ncbi:MAG: PIN domain-containing protein [Candidatus Pacebacteria bacterium]|nr:PIN domain-containing protein [Candidatus Paceibacterota bacterium]